MEDKIESISKRQSAVETMLNQMDVPELRKDTTNISNIRWLQRNLAVRNSDHPMFRTTMDMILWLFKAMR